MRFAGRDAACPGAALLLSRIGFAGGTLSIRPLPCRAWADCGISRPGSDGGGGGGDRAVLILGVPGPVWSIALRTWSRAAP